MTTETTATLDPATHAPVEALTGDRTPGDHLGGKGKALAQLVVADYPVPTTGVITTEAYRRIAAAPAISDLIRRISQGEAVSAPEVDAVFGTAPIDPTLEREIVDHVRSIGAGGAVALRSSATVEDMHGSSFAGQYRSKLDIPSDDPTAVMTAVREVWASLWHPAPAAYRRAFGIDESDVAMAVVAMEMVPATTAGVVFTLDPAGSGDARVEAVEGLGESLVSGERTPSAWVVPREGDRGSAIPRAAERALDLALEVEETFGVPQDVEWAAIADDVVLVQARPITILENDDGFDTAIDDHELTTAGIVEMVPGVLPPLRWELNRFVLDEAFRSVLDSLDLITGSQAEDRPFVRRVRGRAAIDFDQLRDAASAVPGAAAELEYQYFGTEVDGTVPPGRQSRLARFRRDLQTMRTRDQVIEQADIVIRATHRLRDRKPDLAAMADAELLQYAARLTRLAARGLAAELGVAAAGAAAYGRLEAQLGQYLGPDEGPRAALAALSHSSASIEKDPAASAAIFGGPTWHELGTEPPATAHYSAKSSRRSRHQLEDRLRSLRGWRRRRVLTGQIVDVRIHMLRRLIADASEQLRRREAAKAAVLELGGETRRVHLELGSRLVRIGALRDPHDVELLATGELVGALTGDAPVPGDVIKRRRNWLSRYEAEGELPIRFVGVPDRQPAPLPEGRRLEGWAASPGRYRGVARVVRAPTGGLEEGEVLVAEATDASWSPLFIRAGAVIVERGGPLSHAAILARELGLPGVLNVPGATGVLDGRTVSVDGDHGVVVIEDGDEQVAAS